MFLAIILSGFWLFYLGLVLLLSLFYLWIMSVYLKGWKSTPAWKIPETFQASQMLSIIIPARNEEKNITACLDALTKQNYPNTLFEIIVVDDHSTDRTAELIASRTEKNLRLIKLADFSKGKEINSFKKFAIETAIEQAEGSLIVTTDADCVVQENWLALIASFQENKDLHFVAAPVNFYNEKSLFERFQSLDFIGMMGITSAGIHNGFMHMCNGANLAYKKSTYEYVGGFEGINRLASGDDMLLMQKIAKAFPGKIGFLKNNSATTKTKAQPTFGDFITQRIRWASKSNAYPEIKVTLILAMVFFFSWTIIANIILAILFGMEFLLIALGQLLLKAVVDYRLLHSTARFFQREDLLRTFLPSLFYHLIYICLVGLLANIKTGYSWKGRQVK